MKSESVCSSDMFGSSPGRMLFVSMSLFCCTTNSLPPLKSGKLTILPVYCLLHPASSVSARRRRHRSQCTFFQWTHSSVSPRSIITTNFTVV